MPRATNDITQVDRHDLKTCEGGYVELRRMTYGQYLHRSGMAMDMQMRGEKGGRNSVVDIDLGQEKVTEYEFGICIAAHNLTDDQDVPLDFKKAAHVHLLDARVGQEIGDLINKMNTFDEEEAPN